MPDIMPRWISEGRTVQLSIRRVSGRITERDLEQSPLDDEFNGQTSMKCLPKQWMRTGVY